MAEDPRKAQVGALGQFIHAQRKLANLSLRELAGLTQLSNAYLSQLERGLHQPSIRVVNAVAKALDLSAETLLERAGLFDDERESASAGPPGRSLEAAIRAEPTLSEEQRAALLAVYRSFSQERPPPDA